jgi:hypothetical protein
MSQVLGGHLPSIYFISLKRRSNAADGRVHFERGPDVHRKATYQQQ